MNGEYSSDGFVVVNLCTHALFSSSNFTNCRIAWCFEFQTGKSKWTNNRECYFCCCCCCCWWFLSFRKINYWFCIKFQSISSISDRLFLSIRFRVCSVIWSGQHFWIFCLIGFIGICSSITKSLVLKATFGKNQTKKNLQRFFVFAFLTFFKKSFFPPCTNTWHSIRSIVIHQKDRKCVS